MSQYVQSGFLLLLIFPHFVSPPSPFPPSSACNTFPKKRIVEKVEFVQPSATIGIVNQTILFDIEQRSLCKIMVVEMAHTVGVGWLLQDGCCCQLLHS